MGFDSEPPRPKRARMENSPIYSSEEVTGTPQLRPQEHTAGTTSAPLRLARRSADSLDGFFCHVDSGRDSPQFLSYPAFYGERDRSGAADALLGHDEFDPPRDLLNELWGADNAGSANTFTAELDAFLAGHRSADAPAEGAPQPSTPVMDSLDETVIGVPIALINQFAGEGGAEPSLDLLHSILEGEEIENLGAVDPAVDVGDNMTDTEMVVGPPSLTSPYSTGQYSTILRMSEGAALIQPVGSTPYGPNFDASDMPGPSGVQRQCSPLLYHDLRREAEGLRSLISRAELKRFFGGKFIDQHLRRNLLAFFRVLELHKISKLSNLKGVPKLPGKRRIDRQLLAKDLDLKRDYFKYLHDRVIRYHGENERAPAWMYRVIKRFSLNEGRKPLAGLEMPELIGDITQPTHAIYENAGATRALSDSPVRAVVLKLPYSTALAEARELAPFVSEACIHTFLGRRGAVETQRKLLSFIQVLNNHDVSELGHLAGFPGEEKGVVDIQALANDLKLRKGYFNTLRFDVNRNERIGAEVPRWMNVVMEKFSIGRT